MRSMLLGTHFSQQELSGLPTHRDASVGFERLVGDPRGRTLPGAADLTGGAGAGPLVTRWRSLAVARKFHHNAVRSLPEERAAEIAA
jgi:hypothetical protein